MKPQTTNERRVISIQLDDQPLNIPNSADAQASRRAYYAHVRGACCPGAEKERRRIEAELIGDLRDTGIHKRRDAIWLLSEIGGDGAVGPIARLLNDPELREDARAALMRIPGAKSIAALKKALQKADELFKPALAQALRARGERVTECPSQHLVPTRKTNVKPLA